MSQTELTKVQQAKEVLNTSPPPQMLLEAVTLLLPQEYPLGLRGSRTLHSLLTLGEPAITRVASCAAIKLSLRIMRLSVALL